MGENMRGALSTGEAARICGVNFRTISRWIERGLLTAYKLPGRGDRRILREELTRFMKENGIPNCSTGNELPRRVLIVEDEPAMASAIERVLRNIDFETAIASNGFEAGAMLPIFRPGILTLDLRMPGADGLDVLRYIQKEQFPAPFKTLIISADTETRLQEALTLGAHNVIRKPFVNDQLVQIIEQMLLG